MTLVLVTGPPASGKTTLARPLAGQLGLPLLGKDTVKEALFDTLGTGGRAWSRRLGAASYAVLLALARGLSAAVLDANFYPDHGPALLEVCRRPIEVFCRCPAAEVERRFVRRAPTRHPGHIDHVLHTQLKAMLDGGVGPLGIGGPVVEVDTSCPVGIPAVVTWIRQQPEWLHPSHPYWRPTHKEAINPGGGPRDQASRADPRVDPRVDHYSVLVSEAVSESGRSRWRGNGSSVPKDLTLLRSDAPGFYQQV